MQDSVPGWNATATVSMGKKERESMDIRPYDAGTLHPVPYQWPEGTNNLHYETNPTGLNLALQYEATSHLSFLFLGTVKKVNANYLTSSYGIIRLQSQLGKFVIGADAGIGGLTSRQSISILTETQSPDYTGENDYLLFWSLLPDSTNTNYSLHVIQDTKMGPSMVINGGTSIQLGQFEPYLTLSYLTLPVVLPDGGVAADAYLYEIFAWDAGVALKIPYNCKLILGVSSQKINHYQTGSSFSGHLGLNIRL